ATAMALSASSERNTLDSPARTPATYFSSGTQTTAPPSASVSRTLKSAGAALSDTLASAKMSARIKDVTPDALRECGRQSPLHQHRPSVHAPEPSPPPQVSCWEQNR